MDALQNGELPQGQYVRISNRADDGVLLYCSATNSFAIEGTGCFRNADYQGIGNYSNVDNFNSFEGQWATSSESSIVDGDVIIWNNIHYIVIDSESFNGSEPSTNTSSYSQLSNDSGGYIFEWDVIIYDFINDNIKWRIDKRGNKISLYDSDFQWGDDKVRSIGMSTYESYIGIINNSGYINGSITGVNSGVSIYNNTGTIFFDIDGTEVNMYSNYNNSIIECHIDGFSSGFQSNSNDGSVKVYINDRSYVGMNSNSANIHCNYKSDSRIDHGENTCDIVHCEFSNSYINNFESLSLIGCNITGLGTYDNYFNLSGIAGTWSNKYYTPYESTFDYQIDSSYLSLSGLSPSNPDVYELTIPSGLSFIGSFKMNIGQHCNIGKVIGTKEGLKVKLETIDNDINLYSKVDSDLQENDIIALTSANQNGPISAVDDYGNYISYPIQYWSNSGVSSFVELERVSSSLSISRVVGYSGCIPNDLPMVTTREASEVEFFTAVSGGSVLSIGAYSVSDKGVCFNTSGSPTISDTFTSDGSGIGPFTSNIIDLSPGTTYYLRAYATNEVGTSYGNEVTFETMLCLVEGTKILLGDRTYKNIENITYDDIILTWDFDNCKFDKSKPLWIKKSQKSNQYNLIKFSDGSELKTISQHRIFNREKGMFTYTMTDDTPIGTTTFTSFGDYVTVVSKEVINENVSYYNIITDRNINLFANNILTSCRYNNIYPIVEMKFIKDNRVLRNRSEFESISNKYYKGLRLDEQQFELNDIISYVECLEKNEVDVLVEY